MQLDRKRLLFYVETIQLILEVTDNCHYHVFGTLFAMITQSLHMR